MDNEIQEYYNSGIEVNRLDTSLFLLEKWRTQEIISRYLPGHSIRILDAGGGAGAYAFWLKELGHEVHLLDPSPVNIEAAGKSGNGLKLDGITQGMAQHLPHDDGYFDLVLLLGPLYHITEHTGRLAALKEAGRVLKPGGRVACAAISRYASLLDGFTRNLVADPRFVAILDQDLQNGQHRNPTGNPEYFTTAYFHLPGELAEELGDSGFEQVTLLPVEGFGWLIPDLDKKAEDATWRQLLLDTIRTVEQEPSLLGLSAHLIATGLKRSAK